MIEEGSRTFRWFSEIYFMFVVIWYLVHRFEIEMYMHSAPNQGMTLHLHGEYLQRNTAILTVPTLQKHKMCCSTHHARAYARKLDLLCMECLM